MQALSAKHVQSPFKRILYRNDIKHVKVKTEERMASLMEKKKSCLRISAKQIYLTLVFVFYFFTPSYR